MLGTHSFFTKAGEKDRENVKKLIQDSVANRCYSNALDSFWVTEQSKGSIGACENSSVSRLKNQHSNLVPGPNLKTLFHIYLLMKSASASVKGHN